MTSPPTTTEPSATAAPSDPSASSALGRAARSRAPRSSHAALDSDPKRRDPMEILGEQDARRVPELVPVRYGRMLASAFTFYRGAAAVMAADLSRLPTSGMWAQLCGDAHLSNFGAFEAPDRRLVFDLNDFDETLPGPFEWDVKRLAASFAIGGRDRGFGDGERRAAVLGAVRGYREAMREFAEMGELQVWYSRLEVAEIEKRLRGQVTKADRKRFEKGVAKARNKGSLRALGRLSEIRDGKLRIARRPPVLVPIEDAFGDVDPGEVAGAVEGALAEYRRTLEDQSRNLADRYSYVDAGHKVVGVGSVGTRAWIALLLGRDESDPLFLQVKQAERSVLEPFTEASRFDHHGQRVVAGQRLMQAAGDVLLGWASAEGPDGVRRDFYVRQLWDGKGSAEVELMSPGAMAGYAGLCGWSLARAHARSGDRIAIAAYLGRGEAFDRAIAEFSEAYADQNEADYQAVLRGEREGKLTVERGV